MAMTIPGLGLATRLAPSKPLISSALSLVILRSGLHLTSALDSKKAGRYKTTPNRERPLTYEQSNKPDMIGVRKSWNSFNTTALIDGYKQAEVAQEDVFIRKFLHGTWPKLIGSDVIIKRRGNQIILSFMAIRGIAPTAMYFLIGYTEEILSYILKCVVKIELQTITDESELIYKYI